MAKQVDWQKAGFTAKKTLRKRFPKGPLGDKPYKQCLSEIAYRTHIARYIKQLEVLIGKIKKTTGKMTLQE